MEEAAGGIIASIVLLLFALFGLAVFVFWVWMLYECVAKEPADYKDKVLWVLIIALTGVIGAAIYFFARRPKRIQELGQ